VPNFIRFNNPLRLSILVPLDLHSAALGDQMISPLDCAVGHLAPSPCMTDPSLSKYGRKVRFVGPLHL
jgi:hypothetical protein